MKTYVNIILCVLLFASCNNEHFISDDTYRHKVSKKFEERKEFAINRASELFSVFNRDISIQENEALQFLYAYMPLCDLADYNGTFFLKQVQYSFKARETFAWGKTVPEEIFRHFVLPYRVNNENLDTARMVFFEELKDRIINLSMKEAALEVNHWCHEKVNYAPADIRTSGPLSTIKSSHGRCGEESTFTVTAMRAVGIPARQVYTPRWAHCDDNHAWVEVWVDGKWHFLGACEPDPDLNMGWFTEPARRAMLVHTKVFGDYTGDDEVTIKTENYTEINVLSNYADVKKIYVEVTNKDGKSTKDAFVDFGLYNYCEFYPVARIKTDKNGISSLTTGYGDLMIWASKNGKYTCRKISVGEQDTVKFQLGKTNTAKGEENYVITPPIEKEPYPVDEKLKKENDIRLAKEDNIRNAYKNTFIKKEEAYILAKKENIDKEQTWKYLKASEGNWREIKKFIENIPSERKKDSFSILSLISQKDLRDTKASILLDHLNTTYASISEKNYKSKEIFQRYVLNPRIKNENLLAYKSFLKEKFKELKGTNRNKKVSNIKSWIKENLQINEVENYYDLPISPIGVYQLKITNSESRDIFFIALCRSLGVPARLEQTDNTPQYYNGEKWLDVSFNKKSQIYNQAEVGYLELRAKSPKKGFEPIYYKHFSVAKLVNGIYETLDYGWGVKLTDMLDRMEVEPGQYCLMTGVRDVSGAVFLKIKYFDIEAGKSVKLNIEFRDPAKEKNSIGFIDVKNTLKNKEQQTCKLSSLFSKEFAVLIWVEPGKEPTRHLMEEFFPERNKYEEWGGNIAIIQSKQIADENMTKEFLKNMPSCYNKYKDIDNALLESVKTTLGIKGKIILPLVLVLDRRGNIYMASRGYKIGIHEQILSLIM